MKLSDYLKLAGFFVLATAIMLSLFANTTYASGKFLDPKEVKLSDAEKSADYHKKFNVVKIINSDRSGKPYLYVVYVFLAKDAFLVTTGAVSQEEIELGEMSIKEVIDDYNSGILAYNYNPGPTLNAFNPDNPEVPYVFHGNRIEDIDVWQSGKIITIDIEYERSLSGDDIEA